MHEAVALRIVAVVAAALGRREHVGLHSALALILTSSSTEPCDASAWLLPLRSKTRQAELSGRLGGGWRRREQVDGLAVGRHGSPLGTAPSRLVLSIR